MNMKYLQVKVSAAQIIAWIWNNYKLTLGSLQVKVIFIQVLYNNTECDISILNTEGEIVIILSWLLLK